MPRPVTQLDSRTRVVTPENIAFEYRTAGPFSRVGAYLLDIVIQIGVVVVTLVLFAFLVMMIASQVFTGGVSGWEVLGNLGVFTIFVLWFMMQWFYGAWFEARWNGQTPGKRALSLRVLQTDGRPITTQQAVLRNVMRLIDALPMVPLPTGFAEVVTWLTPLARGSHLTGLVSMAMTERHQRLGDLVCGTMVVAEDRSRAGSVEAIRDPAVDELLESLPAGFVPSRTLSRALAHYIGRRRYFGPPRRKEIAGHVGSVLIDQLGLPADTDADLLLCALYNRAICAEAGEPEPPPPTPPPQSPEPPTPPPPQQAATPESSTVANSWPTG